MKKTILLFCFIFCISCSERKADSSQIAAEQQKAADSPFNPTLRKAIGEFIDYVESKNKRAGKVYLIGTHPGENKPILTLRNSSWGYNDRPQYYYIDGDRLILYRRTDTDYLSGMINVSKMTEFRDSIPGFDIYSGIGEEYDRLGRDFRIISPDSLHIIYTGPWVLKTTAPKITPDENL